MASQVVLVVKKTCLPMQEMKRDVGLIPGSGRSPGGGHDNPFQYSCLENPMDRGSWWATVHGVAKSWIQLSDLARMHARMTHQEIPTHRLAYCLATKKKNKWFLKTVKCLSAHAQLVQSCLAFCDPMDCNPPGSSVHGILQARILEWVAISSSRVSSQPMDWTCVSCDSFISMQILYP